MTGESNGMTKVVALVASVLSLCFVGCGSNGGGTLGSATNGGDTTVSLSEPSPNLVAVNPVANRIYVAGTGDKTAGGGIGTTLTVIDGASNSEVATLNGLGGYAPEVLAVNTSTNTILLGVAFQAPLGFALLEFIDGNTNTVSHLGLQPNPAIPIQSAVVYGAAFNSATNRLYLPEIDRLANSAAGYVLVVDQNTFKELVAIPIGPHPNGGLAVNSVNNRIYVSSDNGINVIDGASNNVIATIATPTSIPDPATAKFDLRATVTNLAVNPTTNRIYATNSDGTNESLIVIDGTSNAVITTLSGTGGPIAVDPQTNRVYVGTRTGLSVIDGSTNQVLNTISLSSISDVAVNPTTHRVYAPNTTNDSLSVIAE